MSVTFEKMPENHITDSPKVKFGTVRKQSMFVLAQWYKVIVTEVFNEVVLFKMMITPDSALSIAAL